MGRLSLIALLLLLAFAQHGFAKCPVGNASMLVPAVVGEEGQMLGLSVEVRPGDGHVYMSTTPYVGVQTQNSERIAAAVGSAILKQNKDECDFLFRIYGNLEETEQVDGPSAGAAMALLVLSALSGESIRPDMSATGTIETDGTVGAVGSVNAKATAAAESGARVFITPPLAMYERLLLSKTRKNWGIAVVEVKDLKDAIEVAFSNETLEYKKLVFTSVDVPDNLPKKLWPATGKYLRFRLIAENTVAGAEARMDSALAKGNGEFDEYFEGELNASRELLDKGYVYSAANLAFLTQIDASILERQGTLEEVEGRAENVSVCIATLHKPAISTENYEEVFGGELRAVWARKKLNEVRNLSIGGEDAAIYALNELEYARGWCQLAKQLFSAPAEGGQPVYEDALQGLAEKKLNNAKALADGASGDVAWHVEAAEEAYATGDYGAVLYDVSYAAGTALADEEVLGESEMGLQERIGEMTQDISGFWPSLYMAQVDFYTAGKKPNLAAAFRLAAFVSELDKTQAEINMRLAEAPGMPPIVEHGSVGNGMVRIDVLPIAPVVGAVQEQEAARDMRTAAFVTLAVIGALMILTYGAYALFRGR